MDVLRIENFSGVTEKYQNRNLTIVSYSSDHSDRYGIFENAIIPSFMLFQSLHQTPYTCSVYVIQVGIVLVDFELLVDFWNTYEWRADDLENPAMTTKLQSP
jgi:hypothetical protein